MTVCHWLRQCFEHVIPIPLAEPVAHVLATGITSRSFRSSDQNQAGDSSMAAKWSASW